MSARQCPPQNEHKNFDHRKIRSQGYFMLITGKQNTGIWVSLSSHVYVDYRAGEKLTWVKLHRVKEGLIKVELVFLGIATYIMQWKDGKRRLHLGITAM